MKLLDKMITIGRICKWYIILFVCVFCNNDHVFERKRRSVVQSFT